jgi:hypothetical protein
MKDAPLMAKKLIDKIFGWMHLLVVRRCGLKPPLNFLQLFINNH